MNLKFENSFKFENASVKKTAVSSIEIGGNDGLDLFFNNCYIFPAFCDVHVHLREPGFFYKETIASGTAACARGGYSDVFSMPNLNPVPDNKQALDMQLDIIKKMPA